MEVRKVDFDMINGRWGGKPIQLPEIDIWRIFFTALNARPGVKAYINPKEVEVISWIMASGVRRCYFSKPYSEEIMHSVDNLSAPELSRIKKRLLQLGMVEEVLEDGKIRTYPSARLFKFKQKLLSSEAMTFSFNVSVDGKAAGDMGFY